MADVVPNDPRDENGATAGQGERLAQIGSLVAGFAHEIRNPLSTIGLNLALVKEDFSDAETPRDKRTHKRLSVVEGEVKRLLSILDEFLQFARRPVLQLRETDLNRVIANLIEFTLPETDQKGISLRFFPGREVGEIWLDADLFRAVMVNLLRNATDACREGEEILVSTRRCQGEVLVQVTDTGMGMEERVRKDAFTPYFSTKKSGSGLGLAIARRIIAEHAGRMEVSSEVGKGTQFTVHLPASSGPPPGDAEDDP